MNWDKEINDLVQQVAQEENLTVFDTYLRYDAELKKGPNSEISRETAAREEGALMCGIWQVGDVVKRFQSARIVGRRGVISSPKATSCGWAMFFDHTGHRGYNSIVGTSSRLD